MEWSTSALLNAATKQTGLDDFGPDDYRAGLDELVRGYAGTNLPAVEAEAAMSNIIKLLSERLLAQRQLSLNPIAPVKNPWFILGMPRSGTTALHRLLCADPTAQGLEHWLGVYPQPRPPVEVWSDNPDYQKEKAALQGLQDFHPELFALHPIEASEVDECRLLLMQSFTNHSFSFNSPLPDYEEWLWHHDLRPTYARFRSLLGLIDGGVERRWVLKDPSHLASLDALLSEFPDLRVIYTRRDPVEFLPSICTLVYGWHRLAHPDICPRAIGKQALNIWSRSAKALAQWRRDNPGIPWCSVELPEFRKDPMNVVERIYTSLSEPMPQNSARQMTKLLSEGLHGGKNPTTPELGFFGLDRHAIEAAFEGSLNF